MKSNDKYAGMLIKGFRPEQIASAFDRIRDVRDWKAPIRTVIHASDRLVVAAAVDWFTGTTAEFEAVPGQADHLLVVAAGQRLGPRGDPDELPRRSISGGRAILSLLSHRIT